MPELVREDGLRLVVSYDPTRDELTMTMGVFAPMVIALTTGSLVT